MPLIISWYFQPAPHPSYFGNLYPCLNVGWRNPKWQLNCYTKCSPQREILDDFPGVPLARAVAWPQCSCAGQKALLPHPHRPLWLLLREVCNIAHLARCEFSQAAQLAKAEKPTAVAPARSQSTVRALFYGPVGEFQVFSSPESQFL